MNIYLKIANLNIKVSAYFFDKIADCLSPFRIDYHGENIDLEYRIEIIDAPIEPKGKMLLNNNYNRIYCDGNIFTRVYSFNKFMDNKLEFYTIFNNQNSVVNIYIQKGSFITKDLGQRIPMMMMFDYMIINLGRILMHGSLVDYKGSGIIFTGQSGMGKSTQAGLWKEYKSAKILNGDRVVLENREDEILAHGSPYAGSSDIFLNEHVPVKAIILLGQSRENSIQKVSGRQAFLQMYPRFSMPTWNRENMDLCMNIIFDIIKKVPIYYLSCKPDNSAVEVLYRELFESAGEHHII